MAFKYSAGQKADCVEKKDFSHTAERQYGLAVASPRSL